jgi:phosphatidylglycerophosphatase A
MWQRPTHFIAFGLGSGAMPVAPGTFGTLLAIPFYLWLAYLPLPYYLLTLLILTIAAIFLCDRVSREINVHDHPGMVIDEFIGYWVTMIAAPKGWMWIIAGFVLFRFFDIVKPPPIGFIDRHVMGGLGIILDDVVAGLCAFVLLQLAAFFLL